jgi:predicted nuclease of predicted toxin-antitoxin system
MTSVLVKLDENLGQSHADLVRQAGHAVDRVTDEGLSGATDPVVWERVVIEGRIFVTLDLDFSDVRRFPPGSHPGLLLIRPRTNSRDAVAEILERVLRDHPLDTLRGCLVVADASHTRIRRPPP